MNCSRRDLRVLLPALAVTTAGVAQDKKALPSKTFEYDDLPVKTSGKNKSRNVFDGYNRSGFHIDLHMTELGPGQAPHAPHKHLHEELLMLQAGALDATIEGVTSHLTAGSIIYVASNEQHGWRNPGPGTAQYFVIALGREA